MAGGVGPAHNALSSAGEVVATAVLPRPAGDGAVTGRDFLGAVWVLHRTDPRPGVKRQVGPECQASAGTGHGADPTCRESDEV